MGTMIKIVPDAEPNADGEWITVDAEAPVFAPGERISWIKTAEVLEPFVPAGYHLVATGGRTTRKPCVGDRFSGLDLDDGSQTRQP